MLRLQDKVVIVTGSASGLGRGIATACAAEGAKVVVSDIHEQPNAGGFESDDTLTTVESIKEAGGQAVYVGADVTKSDQVANLVAATVEHYGRLDVMINNAGVYRFGKRVHEFTEEELDLCFNVNAKGSFFGSQEAVKQFLSQGDGGVIVNIVSTAGLGGHPNQVVYNMSKGAQTQLTRCLAVDYGKDNIRVNGICPTYAKTSLTRNLFDDSEFASNFAQALPLNRWCEVEDVASAAVFLASDESSFIHGDLLKVDGGEQLSRFSV